MSRRRRSFPRRPAGADGRRAPSDGRLSRNGHVAEATEYVPCEAEREMFVNVAVDARTMDSDASWPSDPDAMMEAHHPTERWPEAGRRPESDASDKDPLRCVHYVIVGGTDGARARAVDKSVGLLCSRLRVPYAAIKGYVHERDRESRVGRAIVAHVPPSCLHGGATIDICMHGVGRYALPAADGVRCLFLVYVTDHCADELKRYLSAALTVGRHRLFDVVVVYGDAVQPSRVSYRTAQCLVLLPCALGGACDDGLDSMAGEVSPDGASSGLLARGRGAVHSWPHGVRAWDDLRVDLADINVPPRDRFHAHLAWRTHYALTRTGGALLRSAQRRGRGRRGVPSLLLTSARACAARLDDIPIDSIPVECLDAILCAAGAWIDLADGDDAIVYEAISTLRRFVARREADPRMATRPAVDLVWAALGRRPVDA